MFSLNNLIPNKIKAAANDSKKRYRISVTQNNELENVFKNNPRPCKEIQEELSARIDLPYRTVTIWFQNRRAKAKLAGEQLAENVFQWKPPVVCEKSGEFNPKGDKSIVIETTQNGNMIGGTNSSKDILAPNGDAKSVYTVDSGCHIPDSQNLQSINNGTIDIDMQAWATNQPFAAPDWAQGTNLGRNSIDSGSFISDYSNYDAFSIHQTEFDNYINNSNLYDNQNTFSSIQPPQGDNAQNFMMSPGLFTPPLSNSVVSLSSQNSGLASYNGDMVSRSYLEQSNLYQQPYQMSVQSLPPFRNNNMGPTNNIPQQQLNYHHPIQSTPEIALQQSLLLRQQQTRQAQARARAKLQKQRNDAMFSSMRY